MSQTLSHQPASPQIMPGVIVSTRAETLLVKATVKGDGRPASLHELIDHIGTVHHAYLHASLPRLAHFAESVASQHGELHPEWVELQSLFEAFRLALEAHLDRQANVLFPLLKRLEAPVTWHYFDNEFSNPIAALRHSHTYLCSALAAIRGCAQDYSLPQGTDTCIRALVSGLTDLEAATNRYLREEEVLFKRTLDTEAWLHDHRQASFGL